MHTCTLMKPTLCAHVHKESYFIAYAITKGKINKLDLKNGEVGMITKAWRQEILQSLYTQ